MKKLLLLFALVSMTMTMNAQEYQTGLGLRLGGINRGITVKHFTGSNTAIEGILGFARHSLSITALWEKHYPFPTAPGLSWYWGVGGHIGFFKMVTITAIIITTNMIIFTTMIIMTIDFIWEQILSSD